MYLLNALFNHLWLTVALDTVYVLACNYFIAFHLLKLNVSDTKPVRCAAFSVLMTAIVILPNYFFLLFWTDVFPPEAVTFVRFMLNFVLLYRNPVWMAAYLIFTPRLLGLSRRSVKGSALLVFCLAQLLALISDTSAFVYELLRNVLPGYSIFILVHLVLLAALALAHVALVRYIDKNAHRLKMLFEERGGRTLCPGLRYFLIASALWLLLSGSKYILITTNFPYQAHFNPIAITLLAVMITQVFKDKMKDVELDDLELHNRALFADLEEFRGIRHDFSNMLQIYDGYIKTRNFERLQAFHDDFFSSYMHANNDLDMHLVFKDAPAIYGLLLSTKGLAADLNVDF